MSTANGTTSPSSNGQRDDDHEDWLAHLAGEPIAIEAYADVMPPRLATRVPTNGQRSRLDAVDVFAATPLTAQEAVCALILRTPNLLQTAVDAGLDGSDFDDARAAMLFNTLVAMRDERRPIDLVSVGEDLRRYDLLGSDIGGLWLGRLWEGFALPAMLTEYVSQIKRAAADRAAKRRLERLRFVVGDIAAHNEDISAAIEEFQSADVDVGGRFQPIPFVELLKRSPETEWHMEGILGRGQNSLVCAPEKNFKTYLTYHACVCMAAGYPFLRRFNVPRPQRIVYFSGESGETESIRKLRRICQFEGIDPDAIGDNLAVEFNLPQLTDIDCREVEAAVRRHRADLFVLDCLYLMIPEDVQEASQMAMGRALSKLTRVGKRTGATPVVVHHTRTVKGEDEFGYPELTHSAFAGAKNWAGAWLLFRKRERDDPDNGGQYKSWFRWGGRHDSQGIVGLDIDERPTVDGDFRTRRWSVEIVKAAEANQEASEARVTAKKAKLEADKETTIKSRRKDVMLALQKYPQGATNRDLRGETGLNNDNVDRILAILRTDDLIEECDVVKATRNKPFKGVRLKHTKVDPKLEGNLC